MSYRDCIDAVRKAAGRDLKDDEIEAIYNEVYERVRADMAKGLSRSDAARKAGKELSDEMRLAIAIEKRNATINALRWGELQGRRVSGRENEAIEALLSGYTGSMRRGRGDFSHAAMSVDALAHTATDRARGAMLADLQDAGLMDAVRRRDPAFELDVAREMWRVTDPDSGKATGNKHAEEAAKILHKHMEIARLEQNKAGAWIGKLDNYIVRQTHDRWKIRGTGDTEAAFRAWRDVIEPRLADRVFEGMESPGERTSFLRATWEALASGKHDDAPGPDHLTGFKGIANLAKRVSQSRKLHFKSADAWMEYNAQFGVGSVLDGVLHGIERGHRNAAAMRVMGTNPKAMLERLSSEWMDEAKARGDMTQVDRLRGWRATHERVLDRALGINPEAVSEWGATFGQTVRNLQLFKLGGSMLSSFNDIGNIAAVARHNGIGAFESISKAMTDLLPAETAAKQRMSYEQGFLGESFARNITTRHMVVDGPPGHVAKAAQTFMKFTGLGWWTEHLKNSVGELLAHNMARVSRVGFDKLDKRLQVTLRRYGIEAAEWDAIRSAAVTKSGEYNLILPSAIRELPDSAFAGASPEGAARAREMLYDKYSTYITDQTREAMSEPTARIKDFLSAGGTQPGTFWGETVRSVMQFKAFTTTFMMRSMSRELFRSGVDAGGVAQLFFMATALGYVAMTMKEIAKGRQPRTPESPEDYKNLILAAAAQGGGLGIYGDFLFGEQNRFGSSVASTLAGPSFSTLNNFMKAVYAAREGDAGKVANAGVDIAKEFSPSNLFYTKAAMDYLIFWQIQEALNPGWARRYEQRVQKENQQEFWLSPTRAVQ